MIQLRDVTITYANGVSALQSATVEFFQGQFTVLIGPSGAGKSTLLRTLNLLTPPTNGSVQVRGMGELSCRRALRQHRRRTGMIFQHHHLIGRHTALQNVLMGRLGYHSVWRALLPLPRAERRMALECLDRVGLLHKALERAENLSGGEQQRVGIARALVQGPRLILADEPVASLDPATAQRALGLLHRICKEDGLTAVVSLHQLELARAFADRVLGINRGRIVFDGAPGWLHPSALADIFPTLGPDSETVPANGKPASPLALPGKQGPS
jgi:phosphonate transport system ATP-binding protein